MFLLVDRGSNLCAELMIERLPEIDDHLCSIPTKSPWGTGLNERSHRYFYKSIYRLILQHNFNIGNDHKALLVDNEIGCNFANHNNNVVQPYHPFGVMPCVIGSLDDSRPLSERTALIHLARQETDTIRARELLTQSIVLSFL